MAVQPEGTPCWADAMFADVEGAKSFYTDVLGWTFGESQAEFGYYTQAYANGKAAAAVSPPMPGEEGNPSSWCLYLASRDTAATVAKVRENGGEVLVEPMEVGAFGTMALARDPGGAVFGIWQANAHEGFDTEMGAPGGTAGPRSSPGTRRRWTRSTRRSSRTRNGRWTMRRWTSPSSTYRSSRCSAGW